MLGWGSEVLSAGRQRGSIRSLPPGPSLAPAQAGPTCPGGGSPLGLRARDWTRGTDWTSVGGGGTTPTAETSGLCPAVSPTAGAPGEGHPHLPRCELGGEWAWLSPPGRPHLQLCRPPGQDLASMPRQEAPGREAGWAALARQAEDGSPPGSQDVPAPRGALAWPPGLPSVLTASERPWGGLSSSDVQCWCVTLPPPRIGARPLRRCYQPGDGLARVR